MWIIPKNINHSLNVVLDLNELSQISASSLISNSTHSSARIWLQRWRRERYLNQHLYARVLKTANDLIFWTASIYALLDKKCGTHICGAEQTYNTWSDLPLFVSTILNINRKPRVFCPLPLQKWNSWIAKQRQIYSLRLNQLGQTKEQDLDSQNCTSTLNKNWRSPTAQASGKGSKGDLLTKNGELWNGEGSAYQKGSVAQITLDQQVYANLVHFGTHNTQKETFTSQNPYQCMIDDPNVPLRLKRKLMNTSQTWATPTAGETRKVSSNPLSLGQMQICNDPLLRQGAHFLYATDTAENDKNHEALKMYNDQGILNPRWVESLMGLPIGWVLPCCNLMFHGT